MLSRKRAVKKRGKTETMSIYETKFEDMSGLYIPDQHRRRILERYGKLTVHKLDGFFDINTKIGGKGVFGTQQLLADDA